MAAFQVGAPLRRACFGHGPGRRRTLRPASRSVLVGLALPWRTWPRDARSCNPGARHGHGKPILLSTLRSRGCLCDRDAPSFSAPRLRYWVETTMDAVGELAAGGVWCLVRPMSMRRRSTRSGILRARPAVGGQGHLFSQERGLSSQINPALSLASLACDSPGSVASAGSALRTGHAALALTVASCRGPDILS